MSAALRHPEPEDFSSLAPTHPIVSPAEDNWRQYQDQFVHAPQARKNRRYRRHRAFRISTSFVVASLLLVEVVGVIWIYALDLKTIRYSNQLDSDIQETNLQIALTQDRLASHNTTPHLSQWAQDLGYRKALPEEMDNITSIAPMPATQPKKDTP